MRPAFRLLAAVKHGRYLEAGNPTGLTGLFTHPAPRSTLLYLYSSTLDKLKAFPEHSIYRQSAEALTTHRLKIVESIKPEGYEEWAKKAAELVEKNPQVFDMPEGSPQRVSEHNGEIFVTTTVPQEEDERVEEWDGEKVQAPTLEGSRDASERLHQQFAAQDDPADDANTITWEPEPPLEASQYVIIAIDVTSLCYYGADLPCSRINEMETQIGAGLIEEVIQVAQGELKLVDSMLESKV